MGDNRTFVSSGKDGLVCLCEVDRKEIRTVADLHLGSIEALAIFSFMLAKDDHPESTLGLLSAGSDQMVRVAVVEHEERNANLRARSVSFLRSHAQPVRAVALSINAKAGGLFASGGDDGAIKIYDFVGEIFTLVGHRGSVRNIVVAPDHSFVASSGTDGTIRIWRAADIRTDK